MIRPMPRPIAPQLLDELRQIAGPGAWLDLPSDIEPYLTDFRRLYTGSSPLVLRPDSTAKVSALLGFCNTHGIGVVPQGGNTGYCGGCAPDESGTQVVLSLSRLKRVRAVDPLDYSMTVEAGCTLHEAQQVAESVDRLFPLSLGSEGSCQVGGNLSTNAGGTAVLRYGMMRDLVLGLEVVLADGRVVDQLRSLRKDNTGYDLRHLFMGAEGTLGVITAATLKLFPRPRTLETSFCALRDPEAAIELLARLREATGDAVTTFELIPRLALDLVLRHIPGCSDPLGERHAWYALVELSTARHDPALRALLEQVLGDAHAAGLVPDAAFAESGPQRDMFWRIRERIPESQNLEGPSLKHDVSVPVSRLPQFLREATALVASIAPGVRIVSYGHAGDGNLHFNASPPEGGDLAEFRSHEAALKRAIHDLAAKLAGSFSAEHGIGRLKVGELERYEDPHALEVMRAIKGALDPRGIMNPGKLLR